ncbi:phage tail protein I [Chromobacterium subtsugae]|uniref:Phage tail protein I n=1 Tax=Chromobacterium subtsugae TaxID=251747 RepID=A0ABS7FEU3_9NEIS|nr:MULTISPECIES: phage tail protein I [Chromobacterium]KUM03542.1 phage tail protein [Chromobacterium subtsugae]KZE87540.1 phage tail protein [Chromobacterium sp. F49]MBW7567099.1 phage tail protein I [Chromobacterium subtsugae]MBW8288582.1 phage tail protein I [Chromobacterium subtsugae]WSE90191.1 phage tail protein I [Chromobacterium subtsugae]
MADLPLPPALAGDARSRILAALAARISAVDVSGLLVYLVDNVARSALPLLAEQFSLPGDGWELAESDYARRRMIKGAIELHRYKGTPWAIREVIRRLGLGEATLIEGLAGQRRNGVIRRDGMHVHGEADTWAKYRVLLPQPITNDQAANLRRALLAVAPARCHLASLEYQAAANRHNGAIRRDKQFNRGSA